MALDYDQVTAVTEKYFYKQMVDNIFSSNVLLARARGKWYETQDGGEKILMPVAYAETSSSGWYSGAELLDTADNEQWTAAEFDWKQAYANITINRRDELKCTTKKAVINFVKTKVELAEKTLQSKLGTGIYNSGTESKQITGLRLAVDSAGTYGGIARASYSWWAANEDSTTTALSLTTMQGMFGDCTVGNSKPTVIPTTQDLFDIYWAKLQPQQRYTDTKTGSAGFQNLTFNGGVPVIVDGHCPANHMFFLNEEYLKFIVHEQENFRFEKFIKPTNQNVASAKIYWMGEMCCNNCRMQGKLSAITS